MTLRFIDTHCHFDFPFFTDDLTRHKAAAAQAGQSFSGGWSRLMWMSDAPAVMAWRRTSVSMDMAASFR